jgi:hypothetical protein
MNLDNMNMSGQPADTEAAAAPAPHPGKTRPTKSANSK